MDTNSYTDDGDPAPGANVPMTLTCSKVNAFPVAESSIIPDVPAVGVEGGEQSYLGSHSQRIRMDGYFRGSTAKTDLDKLGAIRVGGVPCRMTFTAFNETWIQGNYLIATLSYWPEPLTPDDIDAAVLNSSLSWLSPHRSIASLVVKPYFTYNFARVKHYHLVVNDI